MRILGITLGGSLLTRYAFALNEKDYPVYLPDPALPGPARTITAITCGAGARGNVYGNYALNFPDQLKIVGVAEPIPIRNERYTKLHSIPDSNRFLTWEHVFNRPKFADAVIITTPDEIGRASCRERV